MSQSVYEDEWGEVVEDSEADLIEIVWSETTAGMSIEEFNRWLDGFAGLVEKQDRHKVLVDSTLFLMDTLLMDAPWRDANIIPRYNAAGVKKLAFLVPEGMPLIGAEPAPDGPADFPTAYFGDRDDALAWLAS
ncbi:MAG: hypothetical protein V3R84_01610 [Acidimicrobiia bacterium]